jgi:hypothetical protein
MSYKQAPHMLRHLYTEQAKHWPRLIETDAGTRHARLYLRHTHTDEDEVG